MEYGHAKTQMLENYFCKVLLGFAPQEKKIRVSGIYIAVYAINSAI